MRILSDAFIKCVCFFFCLFGGNCFLRLRCVFSFSRRERRMFLFERSRLFVKSFFLLSRRRRCPFFFAERKQEEQLFTFFPSWSVFCFFFFFTRERESFKEKKSFTHRHYLKHIAQSAQTHKLQSAERSEKRERRAFIESASLFSF